MVRNILLILALAACSSKTGGEGDGPVGTDEDDTGTGDTADTGDTSGDSGDTSETGDSDSGEETAVEPVDEDGDGSPVGEDCDDTDATVHPSANEICDDKDNDCDGRLDIDEDFDADGVADCDDFCPVYASPLATGDGRMMDPIGYIQDAVDLAGSSGCNEVRAYQGTYLENVTWGGWPVNAESISGPSTTIIDGQAAGPVVSFVDAEGEDARIYGFTLTNGGGGKGGGVKAHYASPTIEGNVITGNVVAVTGSDLGVGAGIWVYEGSPLILDNEITGNDACWSGPENGCDGGAIALRGGEAWIEGNWLTDNTAGDGGAIWSVYSSATILHNVIAGNAADDQGELGEERGQGGGIDVQVGGVDGPYIANNLIVDNVASQYGGGIVTYEDNELFGEAEIVNNTIAHNEVESGGYGAGICQWRRTTPVIYDNIVYGNRGVGVYSEDDIDTTFTYNLVNGNTTNYEGLAGSGTGNLSSNPLFVGVTDDGDWTNDDFTLGSGSPAIDAGDPTVLDADGSRADVGAFGGPEGSW